MVTPTSGRLIKVYQYRGDPDPAIFAVAETSPNKAMDILRRDFIGVPEMEDLGGVSAALLEALKLKPGGARRI